MRLVTITVFIGALGPTDAYADAPTYHRDVATIVQARCQSCHAPGQIGPFTLQTYADAKRWSATIAEVVGEGRMPPWHANPTHGRFRNDRSLNAEQKRTLLAWIEAGCPEGEAFPGAKAEAAAVLTTLTNPDAVFMMDRDYLVKAEGTLPYQIFVVPTGLTEDKWVSAIEVRPGAREVVHHILIFAIADDGRSLREAIVDGGAGGGQFASYVPGDSATFFPKGMGKKLPAGARLLFQVHYTPIGKAVSDRTSIAVKYGDGRLIQEVRTKGINQRMIRIAPGASNHEVRSSFTFREDATLLSMWPHMHLRGKDFRFTATFPDGRSEVLLDVPKFDFNWQTTYELQAPRPMPSGTRIDCVAHFDNSAENPNNPDPKVTVRWGPQTVDEMMIGYIDYVADGPASLQRRVGAERLEGSFEALRGRFGGDRPIAERVERLFQFYDKDGDGLVKKDEVPNANLFERLDRDGDGAITKDEMRLVLEAMDRNTTKKKDQ